METGEQFAAEIIDAIKSGRDVWLFDQIVEGPDHLAHARKLLLERRDARSDPDEVRLLSSVLDWLEKRSKE